MPKEPIPAARLRQLRDQVIRYVYENGAGNWGWGVPADQVRKALNLSNSELQTVIMLLIEQGLFGKQGAISNVGLSPEGQNEAIRLGTSVPMHEPHLSPIVIHAKYSVVQVAGQGSTQSARLTVDQSQITQIMNQIEQELPTLNLKPNERDEAQGLLASLRKVLADKLPEAAARAIGAALAAIISGGGSKLVDALLGTLHIAPS